MNPQQYYHYQLAASAGVQRMPMYATPHYVTGNPAAIAGGVQLSHLPPPPPPPALATLGLQQEPQQMAAFPSVSSTSNVQAGNPASAGITSAGSELESKINEKVKVDEISSQKQVGSSKSTSGTLGGTATNTTTMMTGSVHPTSMIMPSGQTPSLISGVYAGAYIQQAIPQQHSQIQHPQYMFTASAGMQQQAVAAAPQPKLMFVPQMQAAMPQPAMQQPPAGAYAQPTLFQDQSGKYYMLNSNQTTQHPAFQFAQQQIPGKPHMAQPAGQQYIAPQYYYPQMQAQSSVQGVICDPRTPPGAALPATIQQTPSGATNQQQYHYY